MNKIRRLFGLVEGHEDQAAKQISKRTNVSEQQAKKGINKARETVNDGTSDGNKGE